jgi:hypothetical protein
LAILQGEFIKSSTSWIQPALRQSSPFITANFYIICSHICNLYRREIRRKRITQHQQQQRKW